MARSDRNTGPRILAAASRSFGTRGYEATSLDDLAAELGITKQTILYWYPSKPQLLDAVVAQGVGELSAAIDRALAAEAGAGIERIEQLMRTVFRFAVRRPELLGLVREVSRLGADAAAGLRDSAGPLLERAQRFLRAEMDAGTIRRGDPGHLLLFTYSMVVGVATDLEAQRALGIEASVASLARLRRELFHFLRAAIEPAK